MGGRKLIQVYGWWFLAHPIQCHQQSGRPRRIKTTMLRAVGTIARTTRATATALWVPHRTLIHTHANIQFITFEKINILPNVLITDQYYNNPPFVENILLKLKLIMFTNVLLFDWINCFIFLSESLIKKNKQEPVY